VLAFCGLLGGASRARAQDGAIRVDADVPGTVLIDGRKVGPAPVEVRELARGRYLVRIEFKGGGTARQYVDLAPGQNGQVHFAYPRVLANAVYRRGIHFMLGASPFYLYEFNDARGAGGHLELGFNVGLNARVDFRSVLLVGGGRYGEMHGKREHGLELALRPSIRFNHGAGLATELGVRVGLIETWYRQLYCEGYTSCPQHDLVHVSNLAVGPDLSAISLRFGARGEYELAARGAVLFVRYENTTVYTQFGVAFSYLLLGG
jgi:hypothetical protein